MLLLGIAYAANIGGTGTLIGTPPNLVSFGFLISVRYTMHTSLGTPPNLVGVNSDVNYYTWVYNYHIIHSYQISGPHGWCFFLPGDVFFCRWCFFAGDVPVHPGVPRPTGHLRQLASLCNSSDGFQPGRCLDLATGFTFSPNRILNNSFELLTSF